MTSRRLLITTDTVGGVWDFTLLLGTELRARHDAQVTVLALGEPTPLQRVAAADAGLDLRHVPLKLEWMQDCAEDVRRTPRVVAALAREIGAEVIHANQFAAACAEIDIPIVLTLHSDVLSWSRATRGPSADMTQWAEYVLVARAALRRAEVVTAVSVALANEVTALYDQQRPIEVIYNGWPAPAFENARRSGVLVAGRLWDEAKNIPLVARAAAGWPCDRVLLAGEARHPDSGATIEIEPPFQALGFLSQDELQQRMREAAIFVSPARYDPFGLLPLQAALNGCALLLSDIPSYREVWANAAAYFRSDDAADLKQQWQRLLADVELRSDLQHRATVRARTTYTATRMADQYAELYARVSQAVYA